MPSAKTALSNSRLRPSSSYMLRAPKLQLVAFSATNWKSAGDAGISSRIGARIGDACTAVLRVARFDKAGGSTHPVRIPLAYRSKLPIAGAAVDLPQDHRRLRRRSDRKTEEGCVAGTVNDAKVELAKLAKTGPGRVSDQHHTLNLASQFVCVYLDCSRGTQPLR
jgi:hypothetical protein